MVEMNDWKIHRTTNNYHIVNPNGFLICHQTGWKPATLRAFKAPAPKQLCGNCRQKMEAHGVAKWQTPTPEMYPALFELMTYQYSDELTLYVGDRVALNGHMGFYGRITQVHTDYIIVRKEYPPYDYLPEKTSPPHIVLMSDEIIAEDTTWYALK